MKLSQRKYAEHRRARGLRGGTLGAVQKAIAAGRISLDADGKIDAELADAAWAENTDPQKVREPEAEEPPAERRGESSDGPSDNGTVKQAQLRLLEERTLTAEVKRRQIQGDLIQAEDAERAFGELIDIARNLLLRIPDDLAEQLAVSKDEGECRSILLKAIRDTLAAIEREGRR